MAGGSDTGQVQNTFTITESFTAQCWDAAMWKGCCSRWRVEGKPLIKGPFEQRPE